MSDVERTEEEPKKRVLEEEHIGEKNEVKKPKTEVTGSKTEENDSSTTHSGPEGTPETKNGQENKEKADKTEKSPAEKETPTPKYVFGSSTGFGQMSGFKMFAGTDKLSWDEKKEEKEEDKKKEMTPVSVFGSSAVFGSGSAFGNAFQESLTKKSIFDQEEKKEQEEEEAEGEKKKKEEESEEAETPTEKPDVYQKVHLEKQEMKSGEEDETTIFQAKAKLYSMELSRANEGWREKGLGIIKVNEYKKPPSQLYTSRLVMRQEGNYKLILNLPLIEGFNIVKGMPSSLHADKFLRIQTVEGNVPVQYALKLQVDNVRALYDAVQQHIKSK